MLRRKLSNHAMIDYYEIKSQPITRVMVLQAYKKVRANRGSGGVDDMDWEWLDNNLKPELYKLWNRLTSGSYFPMPVKEVPIKKKGGGERKLGIPTLLDRIAQQVAKTHLERILEPHFHNSSFGYRPARNCHQAVAQANKNTYNHDFVIDMDIKGFFDNIDHELLMKAVRFYCDDKWMEINHPEKPFERYADDVVVHCKTEKQAIFMLKQIDGRLRKCKLTLHPEKTKIVNVRGRSEKKYPKSYDFLGFTIRPHWVKVNSKMMLMPSMFMSRKSKNSVMEKFRELNIHKRRKPLEVIASEVRPIIQGIINYYCKFSSNHTREIWNQLNARLLKWVKWENGLYKMESVRWLKKKYKESPLLFPHWKLVYP